MRKYETIFIQNPTLDEEAINANIEKFKGIIENGGGTVDNVDVWGKRKLAYEINYETEGYYVIYTFESKPDFPAELNRVLNITEGVLRSIVITK